MSEAEQSMQADAAALAVPAGPAVTAGSLLREAREAAGLHIAALAVSLKVPVRKLEALEADRLDLLPDAVFVRALASSVCRTLKVDPAPVLERLPQTTAPRLAHDEGGINAPFRAPSDGAGSSWVDQLSKPVFLAVFALLLGALVLIFLPAAQRSGGDASRIESTTAAAPAGPATAPPAQAPVGEPVVTSPPAPAPVAAPVPQTSAPVQAPQTTVAVTPSVKPPALSPGLSVAVSTPTVASPTLVLTPGSASPAAVPAPLPTTGVLVFKTRGESWIEVTDAKGVVVVRKIITPGETVGASGTLPLAVVIGRADATEVQVRGKPFDLAPVARDNVARFEVK